MKAIYRHFTAAIALIAAVSCTKQEEMNPQESNTPAGTYKYVLNVSNENGTRTTMDGMDILWSADDQIGITGTIGGDYKKAYLCGGPQSISEGYTPGTSADFILNLTENTVPQIAAYPYSDDIIVTSGSSINNGTACRVSIPATQTGIKDNIPAKSLAMVGNIVENNCKMYTVGAVIQFEITNSNIASLTFEGNNSEIIAGDRYYFTKVKTENEQIGDVAKEVNNYSYTAVTLVPEGEVFEPGVYYFVVSPNDLTEGFTMTLTTNLGQKITHRSNSRFNIARNTKYIGFGSDNGWISSVRTGAAGKLGTQTGTTATLYGVAPQTIKETDLGPGFQISTDGENWTDFEGEITWRKSESPQINVFTADIQGITPETTYYYRATYTNTTGATTYGKPHQFKTYANAQSAIIDIYSGATHWPFTNIEHGTATGLLTGTGSQKQHENTDLILTTETASSFIAKASGGMWIGRSGCMTMKVMSGDYIKFPVVEGKKPVSVTMLMGNVQKPDVPNDNSNKMGQPSIRRINIDETQNAVFADSNETGGDIWNTLPAYAYDSHTWTLTNTAAGQYGLYFNQTSAVNCYISYLEVVYVDADSKATKIEQDLVFWAGTGNHSDQTNPDFYIDATWPFNGTKPAAVTTDDTFHTDAYPHILYSFNDAGGKFGVTRAGLKFGGKDGSYMKFHAVEGYKLTSIKIRGGTTTTTYYISTTTGTGGKITEESRLESTPDSTLKFQLNNTSENTDYYLCIKSTAQANIREMWITYELVQ